MMEIAGLENSVPVRMIYVDDKSEVLFKSLGSLWNIGPYPQPMSTIIESLISFKRKSSIR